MQTCFFAVSGVLPREEAIGQIKKAIKKTYGKKGDEVVKRNFAAVDQHAGQLARGSGSRQGHVCQSPARDRRRGSFRERFLPAR